MTETPRVAVKGLAEARALFASGDLTAEDLEAEVEFWLSVEACGFCDSQMCSAHFSRLCGR